MLRNRWPTEVWKSTVLMWSRHTAFYSQPQRSGTQLTRVAALHPLNSWWHFSQSQARTAMPLDSQWNTPIAPSCTTHPQGPNCQCIKHWCTGAGVLKVSQFKKRKRKHIKPKTQYNTFLNTVQSLLETHISFLLIWWIVSSHHLHSKTSSGLKKESAGKSIHLFLKM